MARVRTIHPDGPKDEAVSKCTIAARYVWDRLPCYADKEGRLPDKPFSLRIDIFPTDPISTEQMDGYLGELATQGLIVRYQVAGRRYIAIPNFLKYQNPHRNEACSRIPPPSDDVQHRRSSLSTSDLGPPSSGNFPSTPADPDPVKDPVTDPDPESERAHAIPDARPGAWPEPEPATVHHLVVRARGRPPPGTTSPYCGFHAKGENLGIRAPVELIRAACPECIHVGRKKGARPRAQPSTTGDLWRNAEERGWPPKGPEPRREG
jgi:hypothetical protein